MKIKQVNFEIIFLDFQLNSSRKKNLNLKSIVQIFSSNGGQSHVRAHVNVPKKKISNFEC